MARFLHLPFPRLQHWSEECRQLARILPDAHPKRVERGAAALAQFAAILTRFNGFSL